MNQVTFIRHYKLAPPFDSKLTITSKLKNNLAAGLVDPPIHSDYPEFLANNFKPGYLEKFNLILTSPTMRTRQTAEAIKDYYQLPITIEVNHNLREVPWDPDLGPGRIQRFINQKGDNTIAEIWNRFQLLEKELKQIEGSTLCVTHSFLIQNLYLYFKKGIRDFTTIQESDIANSLLANYLEGFEIST